VAVVVAVQMYGAITTIQHAAQGDWAFALSVGILVAAAAVALLAHRWLYLRNVTLCLDEQRVRWTNPLGARKECPRGSIAQVSVIQGNTSSFISPPISPRIVLRGTDYRCVLRASVRYFAEADLRAFCAALGVPADGPDGVWVQ
jgi:hypothetical protein